MLRLVIKGPVVQRGAWLRVPIEWVHLDMVRRDLTLSNAAYWTALNSGNSTEGIEPQIVLYRVEGNYVEVPRNYRVPYNKLGQRYMEEFTPVRVGPALAKVRGKVRTNIVLRDRIQEQASEALQRDRIDKILSLSCGKGKTVVSLHAAAQRNLFPLLVIVHTEALMDQWKTQIKRFYSYGDDRSFTRTIDVGHIQGSICEWRGYPVAVAMLHSLVQKQYEPAFYNYWRLIISDETHRLGAQTFMQACPMFPAERWGLSATLKRDDGMDKVIQLHLGKVIYQDLSQPLKPKVWFVNTHTHVNESKFANYRSGRTNMPKLVNHLAEVGNRNELISTWIDKCVKDGRTILVLGERVGQLHFLLDRCQSRSKALHIGAMKSEDRKEALTKQVVFATQHLAKEGLDRPAFDTLFILFPFGGEGRLRQSIGRILRIADGKKTPYVFVFEDDIAIMRALANKMRRHLRALDFTAKDVDPSLQNRAGQATHYRTGTR